MEAAGLVEAMGMAEGALFRFARTGDRLEPPCGAMGAMSLMGEPMRFQIGIAERDGEEAAEVDISRRWETLDASSWKLWVRKDGRWDGEFHCGGTMRGSDWEIDSAIWKAVRRRNAALE